MDFGLDTNSDFFEVAVVYGMMMMCECRWRTTVMKENTVTVTTKATYLSLRTTDGMTGPSNTVTQIHYTLYTVHDAPKFQMLLYFGAHFV